MALASAAVVLAWLLKIKIKTLYRLEPTRRLPCLIQGLKASVIRYRRIRSSYHRLRAWTHLYHHKVYQLSSKVNGRRILDKIVAMSYQAEVCFLTSRTKIRASLSSRPLSRRLQKSTFLRVTARCISVADPRFLRTRKWSRLNNRDVRCRSTSISRSRLKFLQSANFFVSVRPSSFKCLKSLNRLEIWTSKLM